MKHHPLATLLTDAADGRFPAADGGWHRVPPWRPAIGAVVAFTGHAVLALDPGITDDDLERLDPDGYGGAADPRVVTAFAAPGGWIDCLDLLFVARSDGRHQSALVPRPDLEAHRRAQYARVRRDDLRVFGRPERDLQTLVTVGIGTAGLPEISFELDPAEKGRGRGTALVRDGLALVSPGQVAVAAAAPGNAASVRALFGAGFTPVGSIQLFQRA